MFVAYQRRNTQGIYYSIQFILCLVLSVSLVLTPNASHAQVLQTPAPAVLMQPSAAMTPTLLKGMTVHPDNPMTLDFILDEGDGPLSGDLQRDGQKLVHYFLAAMTVPQGDLWVNLSPVEQERIIPDALNQTEMGYTLLAQDYLLKKLTASLLHPDAEAGKQFWQRVYDKAFERFGTTEIPVDTFHKVWITPKEAQVYTHEQTVYVVDVELDVMLERDYAAKESQKVTRSQGHKEDVILDDTSFLRRQESRLDKIPHQVRNDGVPRTTDHVSRSINDQDDVSSQVMREVIIPELRREVNEGAHFAPLRQLVYSLVLAKWYKQHLTESVLNKIYTDQNLVAGIDLNDPDNRDQIYNQYTQAYQKGVFDFIREEHDAALKQAISRHYFSGGFEDEGMLMTNTTEKALRASRRGVPHRLALALTAIPADEDASKIEVERRQNEDQGMLGLSSINSTMLNGSVAELVLIMSGVLVLYRLYFMMENRMVQQDKHKRITKMVQIQTDQVQKNVDPKVVLKELLALDAFGGFVNRRDDIIDGLTTYINFAKRQSNNTTQNFRSNNDDYAEKITALEALRSWVTTLPKGVVNEAIVSYRQSDQGMKVNDLLHADSPVALGAFLGLLAFVSFVVYINRITQKNMRLNAIQSLADFNDWREQGQLQDDDLLGVLTLLSMEEVNTRAQVIKTLDRLMVMGERHITTLKDDVIPYGESVIIDINSEYTRYRENIDAVQQMRDWVRNEVTDEQVQQAVQRLAAMRAGDEGMLSGVAETVAEYAAVPVVMGFMIAVIMVTFSDKFNAQLRHFKDMRSWTKNSDQGMLGGMGEWMIPEWAGRLAIAVPALAATASMMMLVFIMRRDRLDQQLMILADSYQGMVEYDEKVISQHLKTSLALIKGNDMDLNRQHYQKVVNNLERLIRETDKKVDSLMTDRDSQINVQNNYETMIDYNDKLLTRLKALKERVEYIRDQGMFAQFKQGTLPWARRMLQGDRIQNEEVWRQVWAVIFNNKDVAWDLIHQYWPNDYATAYSLASLSVEERQRLLFRRYAPEVPDYITGVTRVSFKEKSSSVSYLDMLMNSEEPLQKLDQSDRNQDLTMPASASAFAQNRLADYLSGIEAGTHTYAMIKWDALSEPQKALDLQIIGDLLNPQVLRDWLVTHRDDTSVHGYFGQNPKQRIAEILDTLTSVERVRLLQGPRFHFTKEEAEAFYAEHKGKDFFQRDLIPYMTSGEVLPLMVEVEEGNAVAVVRAMLRIIRAKYGAGQVEDLIHAADSIENAKTETTLVFSFLKERDSGMVTHGGIDLNDVAVNEEGANTVEFNVDNAMIQQLQQNGIKGLLPHITISPLPSIFPLLGLANDPAETPSNQQPRLVLGKLD